MNDDFYIGYLPKAPPGLARMVKRTVVALLLGAIALGILLVVAQRPFAASAFEFGNARTFEGTIQVKPYPALLVSRPGEPGRNPSFSRYLLVAPGKHGADDLVANFAGRRVKLQGVLIYRDANTMMEVVPGSIAALGQEQQATPPMEDLGESTLTGEIVDTKCYFGVMNPGSGKVHRACAARCLSGGIPAGFVAHEGAGSRVYLLTNEAGSAVARAAMRHAAERITLSGRIIRAGDTYFFAIASDKSYLQARGL